jgi:sugar phosphate permease
MFVFLIKKKFLRRLNSKCPATMLADNRMANVRGRIIFLVISIITMKFNKAKGVPVGTICAIILLVLLYHPNIIIDVHINKALENEIIM